MEKYVVLEKAVGETPLQCAEAWRAATGVPASVPLAYAGRLDPMASGKLLVLIDNECKNQTDYHGLDKAYDFSVLLGIGSDTHDVLGRLCVQSPSSLANERPAAGGFGWGDAGVKESGLTVSAPLERICESLTGNIELPYPHFSSKTVEGKPLHTWTLEGRLDEIEIPTKASMIYSLTCTGIETKARPEVAAAAIEKINTIPEVTDPRKALGADFRRTDVRKDWAKISQNNFTDANFGPVPLPDSYHIAHFHCIASSGTYMRTLATVIAEELGTIGLAWHIHRTAIGLYEPSTQRWNKEF